MVSENGVQLLDVFFSLGDESNRDSGICTPRVHVVRRIVDGSLCLLTEHQVWSNNLLCRNFYILLVIIHYLHDAFNY